MAALRARSLRWTGHGLGEPPRESLVQQMLVVVANHDRQMGRERGSLPMGAPRYETVYSSGATDDVMNARCPWVGSCGPNTGQWQQCCQGGRLQSLLWTHVLNRKLLRIIMRHGIYGIRKFGTRRNRSWKTIALYICPE